MPRLTAIRIRAPHQHVPPRVCLVTYENVDTLVREYHSRIGEDRERLRRNSGMKIMISLRYDRHTYRKIHLTIEVGEICDEEFIMKNIINLLLIILRIYCEEIRSNGYFLRNGR